MTRYGKEVLSEQRQMATRILYRSMPRPIHEEDRQEVTAHCGHCAAKFFLEGRATLDAPVAVGAQQLTARPASASSEPAAKRQRLARECVAKLKELRGLVDSGVLTQAEFCELKTRILEGR